MIFTDYYSVALAQPPAGAILAVQRNNVHRVRYLVTQHGDVQTFVGDGVRLSGTACDADVTGVSEVLNTGSQDA